MSIVDRRNSDRNNSIINRNKYLSINKDKLRKKILDTMGENKNIKDNIKIKGTSSKQNHVTYDRYDWFSKNGIIAKNNEEFNKGDIVDIPKNNKGGAGEGGAGEGEITEMDLTNQELLDIVFDEFSLPNMIKKCKDGKLKELKLARSGYSNYGNFSNLDIYKTIENAMARKLIFKNSSFKLPFLIDEDLKYKNFVPKENTIIKAVMFCVMDVSGSMDKQRRYAASICFHLLYKLLLKVYKDIDVVFVVYNYDAKETSLRDFFETYSSGGTKTSAGLTLVNEIIDDRYNLENDNIYICHIDDNGNYKADNPDCIKLLENKLLSKVQHYFYLAVGYLEHGGYLTELAELSKSRKNISVSDSNFLDSTSVFKAFMKLFR